MKATLERSSPTTCIVAGYTIELPDIDEALGITSASTKSNPTNKPNSPKQNPTTPDLPEVTKPKAEHTRQTTKIAGYLIELPDINEALGIPLAKKASKPITTTTDTSVKPLLASKEDLQNISRKAKSWAGKKLEAGKEASLGYPKKLARVAGNVALAGAVLVGSFFAGTAASDAYNRYTNKGTEQTTDEPPTPKQSPQSILQEEAKAKSTTTTQALETTTTQPEKPFEAQPGETFATITSPDLCNLEVKVIELSDEDMKITAQENTNNQPKTPIDLKIEAQKPQEACERTENYANVTGHEIRTRTSKYSTTNQGAGHANQWEAVAGHAHRASSYFGQRGNVVVFGHGSTFSASFADMGALQKNDKIIVEQENGETYTYSFIETEVIKAPNYNNQTEIDHFNEQLNDYSYDEHEAFASLYWCTDETGKPGSSKGPTHRSVARFYLESIKENTAQ